MQQIFKRLFDIFVSFIGLLLLSPIFVILAIWIKVDSKGPIFFLQKRIGKKGSIFEIIKFRTMIVDAETFGDGLKIKSSKDDRITKIGKILRSTSLDELPQLFNVLIGNMSLVGPRPPVTYHPYDGFSNYPEWAKKRFIMMPGITGLAQVRVRNAVGWDDRIIIDIEYVESFSLKLDLKILILTIKNSILKKNIYR